MTLPSIKPWIPMDSLGRQFAVAFEARLNSDGTEFRSQLGRMVRVDNYNSVMPMRLTLENAELIFAQISRANLPNGERELWPPKTII